MNFSLAEKHILITLLNTEIESLKKYLNDSQYSKLVLTRINTLRAIKEKLNK